MTLEPNTGDSAPAPEPGSEPETSGMSPAPAEPWPADPLPGPPPVPVYADPPPGTTPGPMASGWAQPAPTWQRQTRAPTNPILLVVVWVIGLGGLAFLALGNARLRYSGAPSGEAYGYAIGTLLGCLAIGCAVVYVLDRVRASSGHAKLSWVWSMPVAAVMLGSQLAGSAPPVTSPRASAPPAESYFRISKPFALAPTTSDDAALVSRLSTSVGQIGLSDAKVERIVNADRSLAGYLVVVASGDLAGGTDAAMTGMLDSIRERSVSLDVTTVDGRTVATFSVNDVWSATWFESQFFVEIITSTKDSAILLEKAVLDAH